MTTEAPQQLRPIAVLLLISIVAIPIAMIATGPIVLGIVGIGILTALAPLGPAARGVFRTPSQPCAGVVQSRASHVLVTFLAVAVAIGQLRMVLLVMQRLREASVSTITASNLRGVGQAMAMYLESHQVWPRSFDDLVPDNLASPKQFDSILDPETAVRYAERRESPPYDTSFEYRPSTASELDDARIILAWERMPWSPLTFRLFPEHGRWVLFGDGHVECLSDDQFNHAKMLDEARRAEIAATAPASTREHQH